MPKKRRQSSASEIFVKKEFASVQKNEFAAKSSSRTEFSVCLGLR